LEDGEGVIGTSLVDNDDEPWGLCLLPLLFLPAGGHHCGSCLISCCWHGYQGAAAVPAAAAAGACSYLNEAALGGLQEVLAPVMITPTIPQRVFNWWFPTNKW